MNKTHRLDKILSHMGYGSRREIKHTVKKGSIQVNGVVVKDSGMHIMPDQDRITVGGQPVVYREFIYVMLNKPQGVISATEDQRERTVLDILDGSYDHFQLFPVGRLDKDTEGLLLLTNDGGLAHRLLSPRKQVPKTYYAEVEGIVSEKDIDAFRQGVQLEDGYVTMPAELVISSQNETNQAPISEIKLTIMEGKFHQVKRMFLAVGKKVIYLKRLSMGSLRLDPTLSPGQYRELQDEEIQQLNILITEGGQHEV